MAEPEPIEHTVKYYEKGDRPLELVPTRQWFVRLLDKKDALLAKGAQIEWHPESMGIRYRDWTQNLQLDWCISRQRYFGVPIPVWYPLDGSGRPDHAHPIVAEPGQLPVDPMTATPPGFQETGRDQPGGFTPEVDIFDTWFTSSMTPQISSHWGLDPKRHRKLFPADLRPQSHEIIRTWAFYTIAKSLLHEDSVPWRHVAISGWVLDPDRKKMSKSKGNVVTPMPMLERYGADAARYWSGSARLGTDTAADEQVFKVGKRLVTKLFNAGKFVLAQSGEVHPIEAELDRAFAFALRDLVARATTAFERFNHAQALADTESFFWSAFTDSYLELAKLRARGDDAGRARLGGGDAAPHARRAAAPLRAVPALHQRGSLVVGLRQGDRTAVDPPRGLAGRAGLPRDPGAARGEQLRPRRRLLARHQQGEVGRGRLDGARGRAPRDRRECEDPRGAGPGPRRRARGRSLPPARAARARHARGRRLPDRGRRLHRARGGVMLAGRRSG